MGKHEHRVPGVEDFVFCDVRWTTDDKPGDHSCAEHKPGHRVHKCCCGDVEGL